MRRYLMVSPLFPPMSNVGAKRALCFARNTKHFGWDPAVVCLPRAPNRDPELDPLVPDVPVCEALRQGPIAWVQDRVSDNRQRRHYGAQTRAEDSKQTAKGRRDLALAARRFLEHPFDRYAAHVPAALPTCLRFMRAHGCEVIYANSGPFSALLTATALSKLSGAPLVLDLRDPWSIEPNYRAGWGPWQTALIERTEESCFRQASAIILNTEAARDAYRATYAARIPEERFTFIRNHFDPELYELAQPTPQSGAFRIVYYGHLRPTKNGALFLQALAQMVLELRLTPNEILFEMFGETTAIEDDAIAALRLTDFVRKRAWVPFFRCPGALADAGVLLDLMGPHHHLQISGKIYDYMAVGRPVLTVSKNAEVRRILQETGLGEQVDLEVTAITEGLVRAYQRRYDWRPPVEQRLAPYGAKAAACQLASLLDSALAQRRA